jgi:hypothetical protein
MFHALRYQRRLLAILASATLAACVSATPASIRNEPPATLGTATGKTLFAIYLMGSDLEGTGNDDDNGGAGTANLIDFIEGVQGLTAAERANFDVYVAFGGSKRTGWAGMKVADLPMLIEDAKDGRFGNAANYLSADDTRNMGTPETLQGFLAQVKERAAANGSTRTFVNLWDHGSAYLGYGQDDDPGSITVPQIAGAFDRSGLKADMVGFDACLMANLEVATLLKPHARYLLASEELEPGHGWDYTVIAPALAKTQAPTVDLAKAIVDGFVDSPAHRKTDGKTLSVLDLSKLTAVEVALSDLSRALDGNLTAAFRPMLKSATKTRSYGGGANPTRWDTMDLVDFCRTLEERHPAAAPFTGRVKAAVQKAVLYTREDGTRPNSYGLTIASPANRTNLSPANYNAETAPLPAWLGLVNRFLAHGSADQAPPKLTEVETFQFNGMDGQRVRVSDDLGVLQVVSAHAVTGGAGLPASVTGGRLALVMSTAAETIDEANDVYFLPKWDGKAFIVDLGGDEAIVPAALAETQKNGVQVYEAEGQWNGKKSVVSLRWDPQSQQATITGVRPYLIHAGAEIVSRDMEDLQPGDKIAFYYVTVDAPSDKVTEELGPVMTVTQQPTVSLTAIAGNGLSFGVVEDLKGNVDVSVPQAFTP